MRITAQLLSSTEWQEKFFNYESGRSYIKFVDDGKTGTYYQATSQGCFYCIDFTYSNDSILFEGHHKIRYSITASGLIIHIPYLDPLNDVTKPVEFVSTNLDTLDLLECTPENF
ncbi:hypothetical protein JNL27_00485 [bacterium]|nr:hypothetical protein [bacterium]